jgi:hypothetical protein
VRLDARGGLRGRAGRGRGSPWWLHCVPKGASAHLCVRESGARGRREVLHLLLAQFPAAAAARRHEGQPEVDELRAAGGVQQHVLRFHVAVRDVCRVHVGEGAGDLREKVAGEVQRQPRLVLHDRVEELALVAELGEQHAQLVPRSLPHPEQPHNVRVRALGERLGLRAGEPRRERVGGFAGIAFIAGHSVSASPSEKTAEARAGRGQMDAGARASCALRGEPVCRRGAICA